MNFLFFLSIFVRVIWIRSNFDLMLLDSIWTPKWPIFEMTHFWSDRFRRDLSFEVTHFRSDQFSHVTHFRVDQFQNYPFLNWCIRKWPLSKVANFQSDQFSQVTHFRIDHFRSGSFLNWRNLAMVDFEVARFRSDPFSKCSIYNWPTFEVIDIRVY